MKSLPAAIIVWLTFTWAGMLGGISFIEAPLKFQAPGVTTLIGVGIGHLVFHALNRVEIIFALILLACHFFSAGKKSGLMIMLFICLALTIQILWLMPLLDKRVALIQGGMDPGGRLIAFLLYQRRDIENFSPDRFGNKVQLFLTGERHKFSRNVK